MDVLTTGAGLPGLAAIACVLVVAAGLAALVGGDRIRVAAPAWLLGVVVAGGAVLAGLGLGTGHGDLTAVGMLVAVAGAVLVLDAPRNDGGGAGGGGGGGRGPAAPEPSPPEPGGIEVDWEAFERAAYEAWSARRGAPI